MLHFRHDKRRKVRNSLPSDPIQLITRRAETEAHLAALIKQSGSGATVQQFEKFIYENGSFISLGDYVSLALRQFPTRRHDVDIDTRLAVLTDAWNYFPHKARGGKCRAELLAVFSKTKGSPID
jgi:hypothetical protein